MTLPRPITPGQTVFISRRCTQRQFWLKPTVLTTRIVTYCVALAAAQAGVQVHAAGVLSNHWHCVATDPDGRLPVFLEQAHKLIAKAVNASYGRWENLWASEPPCVVALSSARDVIDKVAYLVTNPVDAELVDRPALWPGLLAYLPRHSRTVARPEVFFRPQGPTPDAARLELMPPPLLDEMTENEYRTELAAEIKRRVRRVRKRMATQGRTFLGVRGVLRQNPWDAPSTWAPRRGRRPRVAGRNKWRRIEAVQRLKGFYHEYVDAFLPWRSGERNVVFPYGTYALRVRYGVTCAPAPS